MTGSARARSVVLVIAAALVAAAGTAPSATAKLVRRTYAHGYSALVYRPPGLSRSRPAPLVVMVHGCNTTAHQQMHANGLNAQARRDRFVVLYPDADPATHPVRCWRFQTDVHRGRGDPAAIVRMVRGELRRRSPAIDRRRVYVAGMSSGAMMTAILGATYPDVFAAIAMNAGCAYRASTCIVEPPSRATQTLAREARTAMGRRARVLPVLIMQGDKDTVVPFAHSEQVLQQWRMTDNLVASKSLTSPIPAAAATTRRVTRPGRYPSAVTTFDDAAGCEVLERWVIHGMNHFWPGGTAGPASSPFTDVKGPDGGNITWRFFRRFRLGAGARCHATNPPSPPRRGRHWVGAWAAAPSDATSFAIDPSGHPAPTVDDATVRAMLTPTFGGRVLRVHLSNRFGTKQVTFRRATVARKASGAAVVARTLRVLRFDGRRHVTVAPGHDVVSDPVRLPFKAFRTLAVSVYVPADVGPPTEHFIARQTSYLTAPHGGDAVAAPDGRRFTRVSTRRPFVTGVDVRAPRSAGAVVALGDSLTDGAQNQPNGINESPRGLDRNVRYPDWLARRLRAAGRPLSVLHEGIGGNKLLHDGAFGGNFDFFGPSVRHRLHPDVMRQAGVTTVILWSGINDVSQNPRATPEQVEAGYRTVIARMHRAGLRALQATLTPFKGYPPTSGAGETDEEARRQAVNAWIRTESPADAVVDFDRVVRDPHDHGRLRPRYDDGEHLHMSAAGYKRLAASIPLAELALPRESR